MDLFLPSLEEAVDRQIASRHTFDPAEIVSHVLYNPEAKFYEMEERIDFFGLQDDIPPFSGNFY